MEWNIVLTLVCSIVSVVIGYVTCLRTHRHDAETEGKREGTMLTELGYIKAGIDDIKTEQREQRHINTEVESRLSSVEASAKQAHKRIDRLEGREPRD